MPADPRAVEWWVAQMRHSKGRWAGLPFDPRPWQRGLIRDLYALRPDGRRKHREALIGVGRKAGKSTMTAALALAGLVLDGERGGEVIGAAAKRDQARIILDEAKRMVKGSSIGGRKLSDFLVVRRDGIYYPELDATYKVVSADSEMEQGLNPHIVIIDELHVQREPDLYEALSTAQGAREHPLLISITTAGAAKRGICWNRYQAGLKGDDPEFFFRWWEAPAGCDLDDRAAWAAGNPGYPEVPDERYLLGQLRRTTEGAFRRLHLNQWTQQIERWLPADDWNATALPPDIPDGCEVVVIMDAAQSHDTFAVVHGRIDEHGDPHAKLRVFTAEQGGGSIDYIEVENYVLALAMRYRVRFVGGDPAMLTLLAKRLQERGLAWEPISQAGEKMLMASELLQRVVLARALRRGDDWEWDEQMAGTAVRDTDRGVRISKGKSGGKNDAIIALAMLMFALLGGDVDEDAEHFAMVV
jgi:phage terminase large subunit-like protein